MTSLTRLLTAPALALALATALPVAGIADNHGAMFETSVAADTLPEKKLTKAGLYITAAESADLLAARDDVILLDVRSPEETMFVGYPVVADANIPFKMVDPAHGFNAKKNSYKMADNPGFAEAAKTYLQTTDAAAVIVMCRSGGRSAQAVDALIGAGITVPLYSMVDGFEGDKNDAGRREVNGWKNAGAEWTYKLRADYLITGN
jgi:rhodanese-related sulfurtransferase